MSAAWCMAVNSYTQMLNFLSLRTGYALDPLKLHKYVKRKRKREEEKNSVKGSAYGVLPPPNGE